MQPARQSISLFVLLFALAVFVGNAFAGAFVSMTLQPVPPQTVPPSNYPPGTTIVGQEIILGSVPARVWLEVYITGWAPDVLKVVQATISATDPEQDGGGYSGSSATYMGAPAIGAGDLRPALQPCNTNADCRATMSGISAACGNGEPSHCILFDGVNPSYFPAGKFCEPSFENLCDPQWIGSGIAGTPAVYLLSLNTRFGFVADPGEIPTDFHPSHVGTLILDVPANARGTYTIDFKEDETFWYPDVPPGSTDPYINALNSARITVPCGRCCSGYLGGQIDCVDHVGIGECPHTADQVFTTDEVCPQAGGLDCAECASDADCEDGIACTLNHCGPDHECFFEPADLLCDDGIFCNGSEVCDVATGCGAGEPPCEYYQCDEESDQCHPGIPTVSTWGLLALALIILIAAKLRYRPARRAAIGLIIALASTFYSGSAFAGASITLQPVLPQTVPPSSYPPGTTIVGQEIILGSVPARVWLEVLITSWAPENLKVVQATIYATDPDGGYSGANAMCGDSPAVGAGDLRPAIQPCNTNADCRAAFTQLDCPGSASKCAVWDGVSPPYMPAGTYCVPNFENTCDPRWGGTGLVVEDDPIPVINPRFGFAADPNETPIDFHPSYIGTLVLDVPANARGTYTIRFKEDETFMANAGPPGNNAIPVSLFPARITVPCGRCCSGYVSDQVTCADGVGLGECTSQIDQVFTEGEACPDSGGPDCATCATNSDCDDGIPCTVNQCSLDHQCFFTPIDAACDDGLFCNGIETCNTATGCQPGQPPCGSGQCDESADECRSAIPTVSNWGLIVLCLAVLIAAKLRWKPAPTA